MGSSPEGQRVSFHQPCLVARGPIEGLLSSQLFKLSTHSCKQSHLDVRQQPETEFLFPFLSCVFVSHLMLAQASSGTPDPAPVCLQLHRHAGLWLATSSPENLGLLCNQGRKVRNAGVTLQRRRRLLSVLARCAPWGSCGVWSFQLLSLPFSWVAMIFSESSSSL